MLNTNGEKEYRKGLELLKDFGDTNVRDAMEFFIKAADEGHLEATYYVGYFNLFGEPQIQRNVKQAIECFEKCLDAGLSKAKYIMALIYFYGISIEKDEAKAYKLLEESFKEGIYDALALLTYCCWKGIGTEEDISKAKEYNAIARQICLPGAEIVYFSLCAYQSEKGRKEEK